MFRKGMETHSTAFRQAFRQWFGVLAVGFIGLSARVPRGTEGKGHVSLFVSAYASPMLSGSLYEGRENFKTLAINARKTI